MYHTRSSGRVEVDLKSSRGGGGEDGAKDNFEGDEGEDEDDFEDDEDDFGGKVYGGDGDGNVTSSTSCVR